MSKNGGLIEAADEYAMVTQVVISWGDNPEQFMSFTDILIL